MKVLKYIHLAFIHPSIHQHCTASDCKAETVNLLLNHSNMADISIYLSVCPPIGYIHLYLPIYLPILGKILHFKGNIPE